MIEIKNIVKTAGEKVILDNISLTIESVSFVVLIGPSGCGKTTTLKLINKLIEPTSGEIYIDGKAISKEDPIKLRRNIGYVIQNIGLFPHLTIKENIELIPKLKGEKTEQEISDNTERLIKMVGLDPDEFLYKYPSELSGGQQQRIGVIRAIATDADIILMDEPGVYLHANAQKELTKLFSNLIKNRNQIIYTTHSPFMVDIDSIQNVRTVIKDEVGFSHIYNKITTIPTSSKSTYDTITPLTNALGLNLNYNIGPNFNKKNIIVEGISDYFYLYGYYKSKNIKNVPNIIPSTGGNNIPAIASILFGWNCDFNILLDQDDKGRSVYDSINDSKQPFSDKLIFIDGNFEKILGNYFEIENLFSTNDQLKFGINNEDYVEHKYNYSYNTYNKILLQEDTYDETTIKNFEKVIEKLITEIVGD